MPRAPTTIEVIIPSRRSALVPRILKMLAEQERRPDQVTVVSNVTWRGPADWRADLDGLAWRRLGFTSDVYAIGTGDVSLRRNVGLYASTADVVLFLDDDELPPANLVGETLRAVARDGVVWGNYRYLDVDTVLTSELLVAAPALGRAREQPNRWHSYASCYGGCLGILRERAIAVGGFDMAYTRGSEDQHFALKLAQHAGSHKPWEDAVMVSEPPFVWHRTTAHPYDDEPASNTCDGHVFVIEERLMRCSKCPLVWVLLQEHGQARRIQEYDPKCVTVTVERTS